SRLDPTPRNTSSSILNCSAIYSGYRCIDRTSRHKLPITCVTRFTHLCAIRSPLCLGYNSYKNSGVFMAIQKTEKIWHNGNLIPWDKATLHVMSHVVHYGSSLF